MATYPELLTDLQVRIKASLLQQGLKEQLADSAAWEAVETIRREWGGQQVYVTMGKAHEVNERDLQIWRKFRGGNYVQLAIEYAVSERHVRRIVEAQRKAQRERNQLNLFPAQQ